MKIGNSLDGIRIASPCPVSWDRMTGDERVRHCDECQLSVYNIAELTRPEAEALIAAKKNDEALVLMNLAADMEDKTEKHPVTPGEVIPARELLGDMLLQMNKPIDIVFTIDENEWNGETTLQLKIIDLRLGEVDKV